jgi:hypothetical protein
MAKKKITIKCPECGLPVSGFSEKHVKSNLELHKLGSLRHKYIIRLFKEKGIKIK